MSDQLEGLMMYANAFMNLKTLCRAAKDEGKSGEWIYHNVVVPIFDEFDKEFVEKRMSYLLQKGK